MGGFVILLLLSTGYYCLPGTGNDWTACPVGTFSSATSLGSEDECTACLEGYYCNQPGKTSIDTDADLCDGGFYCGNGSTTPTPDGGEGMLTVHTKCTQKSCFYF